MDIETLEELHDIKDADGCVQFLARLDVGSMTDLDMCNCLLLLSQQADKIESGGIEGHGRLG